MVSRWLDADEERAWRAYRRMFTRLESRLAQELAAETGLSMADYTVLSNLVEAEGRRARVTELADQMQWSQSRVSHQLRRMEDRKLVTRAKDDEDARASVVLLTKLGLAAIAEAAPIHFAGVRRNMIDLLDADQLKTIAAAAETVISHLETGEPGAKASD